MGRKKILNTMYIYSLVKGFNVTNGVFLLILNVSEGVVPFGQGRRGVGWSQGVINIGCWITRSRRPLPARVQLPSEVGARDYFSRSAMILFQYFLTIRKKL